MGMPRGGIPSVVAGATFTIATLCLAASAGMSTWYAFQFQLSIAGTNTTINTEGSLGLFSTCANDKCEAYDWDALAKMVEASDNCAPPAGDLKSRFHLLRGVHITAVLLTFLAAVGSFAGLRFKNGPRIIAVVCGAITFMLGCVSVGGAAYTFEGYIFCEKPFCENYPAYQKCTDGFSTAFVVSCGALILILVGLIAVGAAACGGGVPEEEEETPPTQAAARGATANEPVADSAPEKFNPPDGDWVWDEDHQMFWSHTEYLYLDPETSQYFDPESNMWYDPETQEWYEWNE